MDASFALCPLLALLDLVKDHLVVQRWESFDNSHGLTYKIQAPDLQDKSIDGQPELGDEAALLMPPNALFQIWVFKILFQLCQHQLWQKNPWQWNNVPNYYDLEALIYIF